MVKRLKLGYQVWHLIPPPSPPPSQSHMSSSGHLAIICIKGWGLGLVSSIVLDIALGPYLETISIYSLEIKLHSADNNETFFFGGPDKRDNRNIFFTNNEESGAILNNITAASEAA